MEDAIVTPPPTPAPFLTDLRDLVDQACPDSEAKLRAGTDLLIINALRRIEGTPAARLAAAEASSACRTLLEGLRDCAHLHNPASDDALATARCAALEAIDRLETQLSTCAPPADSAKPRRRAFARSASVVMKKRRPTYQAPAPKMAAGAD